MALEQAALVAEIVSSTALVVSLIYVAVQVRQSNIAARLSATRSLQSSIANLEEAFIRDRDFARLLKMGLSGDIRQLDEIDRIRLACHYRNSFRVYQAAHYHYRKGALDESIWLPERKCLAQILKVDAGMREHFEIEKNLLDRDFITLCEELMRDSDEAPFSFQNGARS